MQPSNNVQIIAEIAQAHDGSLGTAHAYIDAVANAGADAIKFQTHIAAAESTPGEPWRIKFSPQDETRYEYWQRMEFTEEQWHGLKKHADERGLLFYSSPFSIPAVELLERVGVAGWKVASGEVANPPMFERMAATGKPFLLSSGMSPLAEIDRMAARIQDRRLELTIFQCTSMYPTPPEKIGLNLIGEFRQRYPKARIGLSDHSGNIFAGLAAAAVGIDALELHVTFSREAFGPDVPASVTLPELKQLVTGIRQIEIMRANPVDKDAMAADLAPMRKLFMKSIVVKEALPAGTTLQPHHLTVKKPGTGIPAEELNRVVGRTLRSDAVPTELLQWSDLQ